MAFDKEALKKNQKEWRIAVIIKLKNICIELNFFSRKRRGKCSNTGFSIACNKKKIKETVIYNTPYWRSVVLQGTNQGEG